MCNRLTPEPELPAGAAPQGDGAKSAPPAAGSTTTSFITTIPWPSQLPQPLRLVTVGWLASRGGLLIVTAELPGPRALRVLEGRRANARP